MVLPWVVEEAHLLHNAATGEGTDHPIVEGAFLRVADGSAIVAVAVMIVHVLLQWVHHGEGGDENNNENSANRFILFKYART